jgi:GNAT superfamily N-acetyltransferase
VGDVTEVVMSRGARQVPVRPRTDADLDRCAAILVRVHGVDGYPVEGVADPQARLQPGRLVAAWVAEIEGEVVGHVAVADPSGGDRVEVGRLAPGLECEPFGLLCRLFVAPEARGAGAGRRLVETAMVRARARGVPLVLDVMVKDRGAIRLYERLGWRHIGDSVHHGGPAGETPCRWYAWDPR